jgi:hypothetical protein
VSISGKSKLLKDAPPGARKCLALDLDETLVHSSFQVHIITHTRTTHLGRLYLSIIFISLSPLSPSHTFLSSIFLLICPPPPIVCYTCFFPKYVPSADLVVPVTIDGVIHNVYVLKRPGQHLAQLSSAPLYYNHEYMSHYFSLPHPSY